MGYTVTAEGKTPVWMPPVGQVYDDGRKTYVLFPHHLLAMSALAHLFLEAAVNRAEHQLARDQRVAKDLEAVLVRAILRGEYDPATKVARG